MLDAREDVVDLELVVACLDRLAEREAVARAAVVVRLENEGAALRVQVRAVAPPLGKLVTIGGVRPTVRDDDERVTLARAVVVRVVDDAFDLFIERALPARDLRLGDHLRLEAGVRSVDLLRLLECCTLQRRREDVIRIGRRSGDVDHAIVRACLEKREDVLLRISDEELAMEGAGGGARLRGGDGLRRRAECADGLPVLREGADHGCDRAVQRGPLAVQPGKTTQELEQTRHKHELCHRRRSRYLVPLV